MEAQTIECPVCYYRIPGNNMRDESLFRRAPKEALTAGNFTICPECATILTFEDNLNVHISTEEEKSKMDLKSRAVAELIRNIVQLPEYKQHRKKYHEEKSKEDKINIDTKETNQRWPNLG